MLSPHRKPWVALASQRAPSHAAMEDVELRMRDPAPQTYPAAYDNYRRLMLKYLAALKARSPVARLLLLEAEEGFRHIVTIAPNSAEASAGLSMHVTAAFTFACDANDATEALRLYNTMPKADQESIDALDAKDPGSMKIWAREP